jgi:sulfoxide reductase heme-binding subunit YedZ
MAAFGPLIWLGYAATTNMLGVNPIQRTQQLSGVFTIILLLLTLSITPFRIITGLTVFQQFRKTLGMQTFYYAVVHVGIFLWLDYNFAWREILDLILQKRFLWVGVPAFLILLVLAITTLKYWKARLGPWWKRLHRLIYLAGALAALHYAWAIKGEIFLLRGAIQKPLIVAIILIILLTVRLKPIREWFESLRTKKSSRAHQPS